LADLRAKAEKATADLAAAQKDLSEKNAELDAKAQQLAELEAKSKKTSQPNASVEGLKKQIEEKQQQIEEKDLLSTSLQNKLKDVEAQLSELRQREAQRRAGAMRNGLEGRILAVNSSWNFVVISLGDRNGVVNNAEMLIKRGSQLIGKIRITSVEPSTSVADIVANSVRSGMSVQPGDTVIYRGPGGEDKP
jgi:chromosome segregation ATPase